MRIGKLAQVFVPVPREDADGVMHGYFEAVPGALTAVAGLTITPELADGGEDYTGRWRITHTLTGAPVGQAFPSPDDAQAAAAALSTAGVNWERRLDVENKEVTARVEQILGCVLAA